jgi:hypothetical protein
LQKKRGSTDSCRQMAQQFSSMELEWSSVRIQPLSEDFAAFGADYRETMHQPTPAERAR